MNSSISSSDKGARHFFLNAVGTAFLSLFLFLCFSEWLLRTHVVPEDVFFRQYEIYQNTSYAKYVAFGDSHMSQGFAAPPGTLNMGLSGEGFEQNAIKLEAYLKTKPKPEGIILQLEPHMFANYRFMPAKRDYDAFFNNKSSLQRWLRIADPVFRTQLLTFWKTYFSTGHFKSFGTVTPQGAFLIDYTMSAPKSPWEFQEIKRRIKEHIPPEYFMERKTDERMRNIIEEIKKKNISLCLVSFPVSPIYRDGVNREKNYVAARDVIKKITEESGVPYHVYTDLYDNYTFYRNLDHLNMKGAIAFTDRLLKDCFDP